MKLSIDWTGKGLYRDAVDKALSFGVFAQQMANRLCMGGYRYDKGRPTRGARYMTRLSLELDAYRKTGNAEHLRNIANYAFLESQAPEHENFHDKVKVASVTRKHLHMDGGTARKVKA